MKTLVVENNLMEQCLLAKVLTEQGHEVVSFENAEQAVLAYQKQLYPLLIANATLPGMSGLQFCKWVRAQADGDKIFIILVTSPNQPADPSQVSNAGANDFISKPLEPGGLKARLVVAEMQMKGFFERKEVERLLEESQDSFDRLVKTAREGIWWLNADSRTEFVNQRMAELLGFAVNELEGRAVGDFIPEHFRKRAAGLLEEQKRAELRSELPLRRKDGTECLVLLSGAPMLTPTGDYRGALWMVTDVSPQRQLEGQLVQMKEQSGRQLEEMDARLRSAEDQVGKSVGRAAQLTEILQGAQREVETRTAQHNQRLVEMEQRLQAGSADRKRDAESALKARQEWEQQKRELDQSLRTGQQNLQAESARNLKLEETVKRLRDEGEQQARNHSEEVSELRQQLRQAEELRGRLSESLHRAEAAAEARAKDLSGEVAQAVESREREKTDRQRLEVELRQSREDQAARLRQHTSELLELNQHVMAIMAERQQTEQELIRLREETSRRAAERMNDLLKAADDLKAVLADRRALQCEVERLAAELHLASGEPGELPPETSQLGGVLDVPVTSENPSKPALAAVGV